MTRKWSDTDWKWQEGWDGTHGDGAEQQEKWKEEDAMKARAMKARTPPLQGDTVLQHDIAMRAKSETTTTTIKHKSENRKKKEQEILGQALEDDCERLGPDQSSCVQYLRLHCFYDCSTCFFGGCKSGGKCCCRNSVESPVARPAC